MAEGITLTIKVSREHYDKLNIIGEHISVSPDNVAERILEGALNHASWELKKVKASTVGNEPTS